MRQKFISAYMNENEWEIDGIRYRQLTAASEYARGIGNPDVFERETMPRVGTVYMLSVTDFPPPHVMALFPGYVASRWVDGRIETQGTPDVLPGRNGYVLVARQWANETRAAGGPDYAVRGD